MSDQKEVNSVELAACRVSWETTGVGVCFPDYWAGWKAGVESKLNGAPAMVVDTDTVDLAILMMDFALSFALCNMTHEGTRHDVKKAQVHFDKMREMVKSEQAKLHDRIYDLEHAIFHALDDSGDTEDP